MQQKLVKPHNRTSIDDHHNDYYLTGRSDVRVNFHKIVINLPFFLPGQEKGLLRQSRVR